MSVVRPFVSHKRFSLERIYLFVRYRGNQLTYARFAERLEGFFWLFEMLERLNGDDGVKVSRPRGVFDSPAYVFRARKILLSPLNGVGRKIHAHSLPSERKNLRA